VSDLIGTSVSHPGAAAKARGAALFTDDMTLPGMLHGRLLLSPLPHARILSIDTSKASRLPGVKAVITGSDLPRVSYGNWRLFPETQDEYGLALDRVRFVGDEVAAVAAIDRDTAVEAAAGAGVVARAGDAALAGTTTGRASARLVRIATRVGRTAASRAVMVVRELTPCDYRW